MASDPRATVDDRPAAEGTGGGLELPPLGPCRLHWSWIILGLIPTLRNLALPVTVILFTGNAGREALLYAVAGGTALLGALMRVADWWTFRYEVTGRELRVRSGFLSRREQHVPIERIHAVDVAESLSQRLFGVVGVKIETAAGGSSDSDVTLQALTRADAATLRERLEAARHRAHAPATDAASGDDQAGGARLIRAMSPRDLVIAGATAGRVGPAVAVVFGAYQLVEDLLPSQLPRWLATAGFSTVGLLSLAVALAGGAWLLSVLSTVLTFGGFELRRDGDRLLISYGLLDRRRSTIPLSRVQAVVITEGILRQPFGLASVKVESAGYGREAAEAGVLLPLVRRSEVGALLREACPALAEPPLAETGQPLTPLPERARRRYVLEQVRGALVLALLAVGVAAALPRAPWWWGLFVLGLVPFGALLGLLRYRDTGWALDDGGGFVVRGRGIGRTTLITSRQRLQRRSVSRHPLQRRAGLATFRAAVASGGSGGRVAIEHLEESVAFDLLGRLGPKHPSR